MAKVQNLRNDRECNRCGVAQRRDHFRPYGWKPIGGERNR